MRPRLLQQFLQLESASAIILFVSAVLAMVCANSPLAFLHQQFVDTFLFMINEGLMAVFFLMVGLELKREYLSGALSHRSQILLPLIAALGGMLVPAGIYCLINYGDPISLRGWPTPVATDIAFALGVLSLFGRRIPISLKLFLLALAIFDDIGSIFIIVSFFSQGFSYIYLMLSLMLICALYFCNKRLIDSLIVYLTIGAGLWACLLFSGIHPTIAGVILAFFIPSKEDIVFSPLHRLEKWLHPYVAYLIIPLFAFANAGFSLQGLSLKIIGDKVVLGIILGLFLGKQIGVFSFSWLCVRFRWAKVPANVSWLSFYGVTLLCGIGFTMSLFLGTLSFQTEHSIYLSHVRMGVMLGSLLSGFAGAVILSISLRSKTR